MRHALAHRQALQRYSACMPSDHSHSSLHAPRLTLAEAAQALAKAAKSVVAEPSEGGLPIEKVFRYLDKDADGKLSFSEVVQARMAYFEAADGNQDDLLSLQECIAYERQRRRQPQ